MTVTQRLRLQRPVVPEQDLHESVARALTYMVLPPAMWTTFPAGNVPLPAMYATKLARMGLKRGWPDILIVCHQRVYGIELKREGGQLSTTRLGRTARGSLRELEGQDRVFPRLMAAGMPIAVCSSVWAVLRQLETWGLPMRPYVA